MVVGVLQVFAWINAGGAIICAIAALSGAISAIAVPAELATAAVLAGLARAIVLLAKIEKNTRK